MTAQTDMVGRNLNRPIAAECTVSAVNRRQAQWTGVRRGFALAGAVLCLILGAIGLLLPVVPTTPFVLLASWLLLRSSNRLYMRLINSRMFGSTLRTWEETRSITRQTRNYAIAVVTIGATGTMLASFVPWPLRLLTACGAAIGIRVILRLPLRTAAALPQTAAEIDETQIPPPAVRPPAIVSAGTADPRPN